MKRYIKLNIFALLIATIGMVSCVNDLDTLPIDPNESTPDIIYADKDAYKQVLAKCYAGLALSGQQGPAGKPDISGIDEGFSTYLRQYFKAQELSTDEAECAWGDAGLSDYHDQNWTSSNPFITAMYNRIFYQITLVNEFLREATDAKLDGRGQSDMKATVVEFRAEARFLRALSYLHALDMYGNVPFVTDEHVVGGTFPQQILRADLFKYVETELLESVTDLKEPQANEYGRVDKAAAWMLLARLYLNAEVYTGTPRYADAATYAKKTIDEGGYILSPVYAHLFMADNDKSEAAKEIIFPITFDGQKSQTWGGMTYLIAAGIGGDMPKDEFGTNQGWGGNRTTSAFVNKFADISGDTDSRAMFFTTNQSIDIVDRTRFQDGYAITKWKNLTTDGQAGSHGDFMDTDFPMIRLAEAHLIYAECAVRGGADRSIAVDFINDLRDRAYGDNSGDIADADLTLSFILDERARELYWEGHRRTDLIRFGQFTDGDYMWPWKGGVADGKKTESWRNLFPLPASDVGANTNLDQNKGYN